MAIFLNSFDDEYRFSLSIFFSISLIFNFVIDFDKNKSYLNKPSNLEYICKSKGTRDFYYNWARYFDEDFFRKICKNKKLFFE